MHFLPIGTSGAQRLMVALLATALSGCGADPPEPVATKPAKKTKKVAKAVVKQKATERPADPQPKEVETAPAPPVRSLADLAAQAEAQKDKPLDPLRFKLPEVHEAKCAARGIRKLSSQHLTLYTDVPSAVAVDELPHVFDLALPQWLAYFKLEPTRGAKWHMVGVLAAEKERFAGTGLWPDDLPPFLHGYMRDRQFWLYEQPSDFYRRELLLHEGTHGFMWNFLGGLGPPWYSEGMAELLGTHEWDGKQLTLGVVPPSKEASPMWGRVKVLKEAWSAGTALPLDKVMSFPQSAHLRTEPYAWSWAAAVFFDHDPKYRDIFREAPQTVSDVTPQFSERLINRLPEPPGQIGEQWQCFVANIEYGYDVARESIVRKKDPLPLPDEGATIEVAADRGWQSSGYALKRGNTYRLSASGQFQIGKSTEPWRSEAGGITLRYHKGRPIGMLLAAVTDEGESNQPSPLVSPIAIGLGGDLKPASDGVLYLRVNDSPAELADNEGRLSVSVKPAE